MGAGPDPLSADLPVAVARAYAVFACPAPPDLGVCTACCMDPATARAMLAKAPQDLTLAEVQDWLSAAFGPDPGGARLRWILPRILDLLAEGRRVALAGNELALRRLAETGFPAAWSVDEGTAVQDLCLHVLDHRIAAQDADLDGFMCMISLAGLPLDPFLARLDALPEATFAALCRANWWRDGRAVLPRSAHWPAGPDDQRLRDWALATDTILRIDRAGQAGDPRAAALAEALWHLTP